MKSERLTVLVFTSLILISCNNKTTDKKTELMDSLKAVYAGNYIGISVSENQAGAEPLTSEIRLCGSR